MQAAPRILYMLYKNGENGILIWQLGGGSSTPARPKVYQNKKMAEKYAKAYGAFIKVLEF